MQIDAVERLAVVDPTVGHVLLAVGDAAALAALVLLLQGRLPGRPPQGECGP